MRNHELTGNPENLRQVGACARAATLLLLCLACAASPPTPAPALPRHTPQPAGQPQAAAGDQSLPACMDYRLGPPVRIGAGGVDGFVSAGDDGVIHVVYGGKYRSGAHVEALGPEETVTDLAPFNTVRMTVAANGQPHVVFTTGQGETAKRSYYTTRVNGRWIPAEPFADGMSSPVKNRAYKPDVAVDERGAVLASVCLGRSDDKPNTVPAFFYYWRSPEGKWSDPGWLTAHHSSTARVEYLAGRGFYLLWQFAPAKWRIAGPVAAGGKFSEQASVATGSDALPYQRTVQNEGADFRVTAAGTIVTGIVRERRKEEGKGPTGVWAAIKANGAIGTEDTVSPAYLGGYMGDEVALQPVPAFDRDTGDAMVVLKRSTDGSGQYAIHRHEAGWRPAPEPSSNQYCPLFPEGSTPQGTLRQGPSVADMRGPGFAVLVRDGQSNWFLRAVTPVETSVASHHPVGDTRTGANRLTAEEKAAGWRLLFDGTSTDGWRGIRSQSFPEKGWIVAGGEIRHDRGVVSGDLVTVEEFENFDLRLEYKLPPGANSGLKYLVDENFKSSIRGGVGFEYQILDGLHYLDSPNAPASHSIASLYDLKAAVGAQARPAGQWNQVRVLVDGRHIEHWFNGKKVLEFERDGEELRRLIANSKFKKIDGFGKNTKGRILLQEHDQDEVAFRNIKIKVLPVRSPVSAR